MADRQVLVGHAVPVVQPSPLSWQPPVCPNCRAVGHLPPMPVRDAVLRRFGVPGVWAGRLADMLCMDSGVYWCGNCHMVYMRL